MSDTGAPAEAGRHAELRAWAEALAPAGSTQAIQVRALLAEYDALTAAARTACELHTEMVDVIALQAELLAARAERQPLPPELLAALAPVVEFVRRILPTTTPAAPDHARVSFSVTVSMPDHDALTLGHLRALAAFVPPPAPPQEPSA